MYFAYMVCNNPVWFSPKFWW